MSAQSTTTPMHLRVRAGLRKPHNWLQLVRFAAVGASGYVVNLVTFALLVHTADLDYRLAATGAFLVAVTNNFLWNRRWTFRARDGHRGGQAARFLTISVLAFAFNLVVLWLLVERMGIPEVPAQAVAIVAATPLSFVGNKLWSFAR
ncbi:MAG: GtrA family protein [Solirubrobacteraceae bacterium]